MENEQKIVQLTHEFFDHWNITDKDSVYDILNQN